MSNSQTSNQNIVMSLLLTESTYDAVSDAAVLAPVTVEGISTAADR